MLNQNSHLDAAPALARRSNGFSLVEMMLASSAMILVVVYTMGTFTVHHQTSTVIEDVAEASQNMRGVATMIERDIRNAGYMVPDGGSICALDSTVGPDTIFASDTDAILPVDQLPEHLAGGELGAKTNNNPLLNVFTMTVDDVVIDGTPTYYKDPGSAALDSDFRVNGGVIVVDAMNPDRGTACGVIQGVGGNTITAEFVSVLGGGGGATDLRALPAHVYRVDPVAVPPVITRDGIILAENVEDLQVAFFFDNDEDGIVDVNEYRGSTGLNLHNSTGANVELLREVRFHVIVQTASDDPRNRVDAGRGQARENRTLASAPANDGRHRRVYTSVVRVRNIEL